MSGGGGGGGGGRFSLVRGQRRKQLDWLSSDGGGRELVRQWRRGHDEFERSYTHVLMLVMVCGRSRARAGKQLLFGGNGGLGRRFLLFAYAMNVYRNVVTSLQVSLVTSV